MSDSWTRQARTELIELRGASPGWSYRRRQVASVEPTVLASLALIASGDGQTSRSDIVSGHEAARWLVAAQRPDGSLPPSEGLSAPGWASPYALLLWGALAGYQQAASRARTWLLGRAGEALPIDSHPKMVIGHDARLVGWPWVQATHSWLEPTALAILALCRAGHGDYPRVKAGLGLILDRAIDTGGWNYGNRAVFGTRLRPQPGPTGIALLALAAANVRSAAVARGLNYLREAVPNLRAPVSLGWGLLGLRAHEAFPDGADAWLAAACARSIGKPDSTMALALLLLASSEPALGLIITPSQTPSR